MVLSMASSVLCCRWIPLPHRIWSGECPWLPLSDPTHDYTAASEALHAHAGVVNSLKAAVRGRQASAVYVAADAEAFVVPLLVTPTTTRGGMEEYDYTVSGELFRAGPRVSASADAACSSHRSWRVQSGWY